MYMSRRLGSVLGGLLLGAACAILAVFLHHEGIILAGAWAGIIGLAGIPIGILAVWLAWPREPDAADSPDQKPRTNVQHNQASGLGATFAVQDGNQFIYYKQPSNDITDPAEQRHGGEGSEP
jgi:hypothetical protein